jgi:serine/threonine-protein kinase
MLAYSSDAGLSLIRPGSDSVRALTKPGKSMHHDPYVPPGSDVALFHNTTDGRLGIASLASGQFSTADVRIESIVGWNRGVLLYVDPAGQLMAVRLDLSRRRVTGRPVRVEGVSGGVGWGALARDGTLVLRLLARSFQLAEVDENGVGGALLPDTVEDLVPRYSPDGTRIALLGTLHGKSALWIYDVRSRTLSSLPVRLDRLSSVSWAPNGRDLVLVALLAAAGERAAVYIAPADASAPDSLLFRLPPDVVAVDASLMPDGHTLLIATFFGEGGANLYVASPGRDSTLVPFAAGPANEDFASVSPDGRWIAYASDESGGDQVYVRPIPGPGARIQVSDSGGSAPVWAADGKRLFYLSGRALMLASLDEDGARGALRVSGVRQLFDNGPPQGSPLLGRTYDVSPDGRHVVLQRAVGEGRSQIVVWLDWFDEMRSRLFP